MGGGLGRPINAGMEGIEQVTMFKRIHFCRECGETIPIPGRLVHDECRKQAERNNNYNYIANAKTLDERLARIDKQKRNYNKRNAIISAANQIYRELQGETKKSKPKLLPPATCVVCGIIILTNNQRRVLCGSRSCKEDRKIENSNSRYLGTPVRATPRMIAIADRKDQRQKAPVQKLQRQVRKTEESRERMRRVNAIYLAMREMNLLPTAEEIA